MSILEEFKGVITYFDPEDGDELRSEFFTDLERYNQTRQECALEGRPIKTEVINEDGFKGEISYLHPKDGSEMRSEFFTDPDDYYRTKTECYMDDRPIEARVINSGKTKEKERLLSLNFPDGTRFDYWEIMQDGKAMFPTQATKQAQPLASTKNRSQVRPSIWDRLLKAKEACARQFKREPMARPVPKEHVR